MPSPYADTEAFYTRATTDIDGVVRWDSNGSVPPADILAAWAALGLPFILEASTAAREADLATFLAEYRRSYTGPTAEQRAEQRAAFGPGVELVDVITGHRYTT
jgi:hypothetical protein